MFSLAHFFQKRYCDPFKLCFLKVLALCVSGLMGLGLKPWSLLELLLGAAQATQTSLSTETAPAPALSLRPCCPLALNPDPVSFRICSLLRPSSGTPSASLQPKVERPRLPGVRGRKPAMEERDEGLGGSGPTSSPGGRERERPPGDPGSRRLGSCSAGDSDAKTASLRKILGPSG